jgi:hypothetical protein
MKLRFIFISILGVIALLLFFLVRQAGYNMVDNKPLPTPTTTSIYSSPTPQLTSQPVTTMSTWIGCTVASECIIASSICGPGAVNKKYKAEYEADAREKRKVANCALPKNPPRTVTCEKNQCVVVEN